LRDPAGAPVRIRGANMDITKGRLAEEALRASEAQLKALTARLFAAQDEERKRVARELHDDFNQRMAMLANDVTVLEKELPEHSARRLRNRILFLRAKVNELSDDLRCAARRLHPSALEHFGLVVALESLCSQFSQTHPIQLEFAHRRIGPGLRGEVALCLYRVAQESLNNIARHSQATEARVSLETIKRRIRLSISDNGCGFECGLDANGFGLISMRERMRAVDGTLSIDPGPGRGTRIDAEVPVRSVMK
jgi:signal transduction histidine kinase